MNRTEAEQEAIARKNFHGFFREWWFSVCIMLTVCVTASFSPQTVHQLALVHDRVSDGEIWRILTSQLVHLNINHTMMNLVGYLIISVSFRVEITPKREAIGLLICMLGVGLGIYWFNPEIAWYVGLSGAIWGMLTHYLIIGWRRAPMLSLLFGGYMVVKTAYEQVYNDPDSVTSQMIGGSVAVDSHLYGIITGMAIGLLTLLWRHQQRHPANGNDQHS